MVSSSELFLLDYGFRLEGSPTKVFACPPTGVECSV